VYNLPPRRKEMEMDDDKPRVYDLENAGSEELSGSDGETVFEKY